MQPKKPVVKLSIIVTCYNVEEYIGELMHSICPQLSRECQLIVIDDCSTDKTLERIRSAMKFYVFDEPHEFNLVMIDKNVGVSKARNYGLDNAIGEYVAFIDGDDNVSRDYVSKIIEALRTHQPFYELSWRRYGTSLTYHAGRLPKWNFAVWARVIRKDLIVCPFREGVEWGEDRMFLDDNLKNRGIVSAGRIESILYAYRHGRQGSLTEKHKGEKK